MANDVAIRRGGDLAEPLRLPDLPPDAARAVWVYRDRRATGRLARDGVPALPGHLRRRAALYVAEAEAAGAPAGFDLVLAWLLPLAAAVRNPPSREDAATRAAAIVQACHDLPAWGFNGDTARTAVAKFDWWPSAAEVRALIHEATREGRETVEALRAIAAAPEREEPQAMSAEVRCDLAAKLRAAREDVEARASAAERANPSGRPIKASHLAPGDLERARAASPMVQAARAAAGGEA